MAKGKEVRIPVLLECTACVRNGVNKNQWGFPDILLKRTGTIRLIDWSYEKYVHIVTSIRFTGR